MARFRLSLGLLVVIAVGLISAGPASAISPMEVDASYGVGGESPLRAAAAAGSYTQGVLQPDGKLLVVYVPQDQVSPTIVRLNIDGTVDTSFGNGGSVTLTRAGAIDITILKILIGADGTIYVATNYFRIDAGDYNWTPAFWAFTSSGAPKSDFGTAGVKLFPPDPYEPNYVQGASFTPDGKIAFAFNTRSGGKLAIGLTLMNSNGSVASSGVGGEAGVDVEPRSLVVTSSGRVLVGGAYGSTTGTVKLYAFTPTLIPDNSWGTLGIQSYGLNAVSSIIYGLIPLGDRAVAFGTTASGAGATFYESDGKLSTTAGAFGTNRFSPFNSASAYLYTGGIVGGGKVLLGGVASDRGYLARLNPDGGLDSAFGSGGIAPIADATASVFGAQMQSDGKYLVIAYRGTSRTLLIRRYWGEAQPQPAIAGFSSSLKSKLKARKLRTIKGTATGTQLTGVELAIQKVDAKLLKKKRRCTYIKSTKTTIKKIKSVKRKCVPGVWIPATGTAAWSLKLKKALKPGKYVISVRASGLAGVGAIKSKRITLTK